MEVEKADESSTKTLSFVEKPNLEHAKKMLSLKDFFGTPGSSCFGRVIFSLLSKSFPKNLISPVEEAINKGKNDLDFLRLDATAWKDCQDISIDYAIMEKSKSLVTIPMRSCWSDLGDWSSSLGAFGAR